MSKFYQQLANDLNELEQIILKGPGPGAFKWFHQHNGATPDLSKSIFIGMQAPQPAALVLNYKDVRISGSFHSVSALVALDPASSVRSFIESRAASEELASPGALLEKYTIYVEDASPDSVLGVYLLLMKIAGLQPGEFENKWIHNIGTWEAGYGTLSDTSDVSWPILQSALGHLHFSIPPTKEKNANKEIEEIENTKEIKHDGSLGLAWIRSLRLLNNCQRHRYEPESIPANDRSADLQMAHAAIAFEKQLHINALKRAERIQLLLPVRGVVTKSRLIDAIILEEEILSGLGKIFLRNDRTTTYFKNGYEMLILHREKAAGTGNNITASVDPRSGLDVTELWKSLERTEWHLWEKSEEDRPVEGPEFPGLANRQDTPLKSVLDETGFRPCLQPWYIDLHRSLIAAPRSINKRLASKITWQEFINIVWDRFHPVRNVYVRVLHFNSTVNANASQTYTISTARPLLEVRPAPDTNRRKSLLLIRWDTKNKDLSLLPTPTFQRILASLILVGTGPVRIDTLPPIETLDFILLPGGFCVIHEAGIVLFDDWQRHDLPVAELHTEIKLLMDRYDYLEGGTGENSNALRIRVHELGQAIMGLNQGRYKKLSKEKLLMQINKIKLEVERTWLNTEGALRWRDFRAAVEKRWRLTGAKEEIYATLDRLESTLRTETEIRTGKLVSILTIYGFPIAIFAGFFSYTMEGWGLLQGADRFLNGNIHGIHIPGLLTFGGLSVATVLLMKLFFWLKK